MAKSIIARSGHEPKSRLEKGWALYSEHAQEIIASYGQGVWLVPSQSGNGVYEVRVTRHGECCECLAWEFSSDKRCKHSVAARYAAANSELCSFCGQRFPYGELQPVDGDYLYGLACKGCGA